MKILLKSLRSGKYCRSAGEWTDRQDEALDFMTSDEAIRFAQQHRLREVQVVAQLRDQHYFIQIPYKFDVLAEA